MIANILQILGGITGAVGIGLIYPPAGVIALGAFALLIGISLEKR